MLLKAFQNAPFFCYHKLYQKEINLQMVHLTLSEKKETKIKPFPYYIEKRFYQHGLSSALSVPSNNWTFILFCTNIKRLRANTNVMVDYKKA